MPAWRKAFAFRRPTARSAASSTGMSGHVCDVPVSGAVRAGFCASRVTMLFGRIGAGELPNGIEFIHEVPDDRDLSAVDMELAGPVLAIVR